MFSVVFSAVFSHRIHATHMAKSMAKITHHSRGDFSQKWEKTSEKSEKKKRPIFCVICTESPLFTPFSTLTKKRFKIYPYNIACFSSLPRRVFWVSFGARSCPSFSSFFLLFSCCSTNAFSCSTNAVFVGRQRPSICLSRVS